jgi:hypothetical protein
VPGLAAILGLAGLLPFLGALALAALLPEARPAALAGLGAYGAAILSFLGAVHWGLALASAPGTAAAAAAPVRLGLGVVPALAAWIALLLPATPSLLLLAGSLLATALVEAGASRRGLLGQDYMRLRWVLTVIASTCLLLGAALAR